MRRGWWCALPDSNLLCPGNRREIGDGIIAGLKRISLTLAKPRTRNDMARIFLIQRHADSLNSGEDVRRWSLKAVTSAARNYC